MNFNMNIGFLQIFKSKINEFVWNYDFVNLIFRAKVNILNDLLKSWDIKLFIVLKIKVIYNNPEKYNI